MERHRLAGFIALVSTLILSGCVARTYSVTRDRIDQNLSEGNRGYIEGKAPEVSGENTKTTRTVQMIEVELGFTKKINPKYTSTAPVAPATEAAAITTAAPVMEEQNTAVGFEKYTVEKNDTLQKISKKVYGTTKKWPKIYDANKDTLKGPNNLYPGQVLNIPKDANQKPSAEENKETQGNLK